MKKFKKIIAMGCAAVMAISAMSMSAFASTDEVLEGVAGVPIVLYDSTVSNEDGIMPLINDTYWTDIPHSNAAGTNGAKVSARFRLPTNHTQIKVTITGLDGGIKNANLSLWDDDNNTPIRTYDYYGDSFIINGSKGDSFTYYPTDNTKDMIFVVKGSTYDYGDNADNGGSVTIKVVSQ